MSWVSVFKIFYGIHGFGGRVPPPPEDTFQTSLPISIGRHEITDPHGEKRPLTVGEIVVHSSNIGVGAIGAFGDAGSSLGLS